MPSGKPGTTIIATYKCQYCGKEFSYPKYPSWPERKYCSRSCSNKANVRRGPNNNRWNCGIYTSPDGRKYKRTKDGKYKAEYRLLIEKVIERKLKPYEVVHHIDGNIHNNDISNLQVMTRAEHAGLHGKQNCNLFKNRR